MLSLAVAVAVLVACRVWLCAGIILALVAALLPIAAFVAGACAPWPGLVRWFTLVYAIAAVFKALALSRSRAPRVGLARGILYLTLYPGLDPARAFARDPAADRPRGRLEVLAGLVEVAGSILVAELAERWGVLDAGRYPAAWAYAIQFTLFMDGSFRAVMGMFRAAGRYAEDVFRSPWLLEDLSDFWGRRWNRFVGRTLTLEVLAPLQPRVGRVVAVLATFLASGVMHEVLFVMPTGVALGQYVAFFLAQGVALIVLARLIPGRLRTPELRFARRLAAAAVLIATAPLFFGDAYRLLLPFESAF